MDEQKLRIGLDLRERTKQFALRSLKLFKSLPHSPESQVVGRQLLRSATSIAANYRAAQRARSRAEFISKLGIVIEEADETQFWLEMLRDGELVAEGGVDDLIDEASQLVAIFVASRRTSRS